MAVKTWFPETVADGATLVKLFSAAVVEVGRAVLDAPQREGLHRSVPRFVLEEPLHAEFMHLVIEVEGRRMAGGALRLAKE